ncbi:uncharacterized protein [Dermacentor albipictus]|uniref:uncharacterized protein n=1 Tax=Dermacentor albipictus TaxID=60249 RepID=UPI0031FCE223
MSLVEALINDPVVLSVMSEVRKAKGVHVYLDEPDPEALKNLKLTTPIDDLDKSGTARVRYTALVQATKDEPVFALGILDHYDDYYAVEAGINAEHRAYGCVNDGKSWQPLAIIMDYKPKKNDYIAISITLKSPYGPNAGGNTPKNEVQVSMNDKYTKKVYFTKDDLRHVTRRLYYHGSLFTGIQVLEHHLEYTGITAALPREANKPYISLKFADVCHLSAGGYAVIEGKYKKIDSALSGILIGVDKSGDPEFHKFPSYNNPQEVVTILVSIGEKYCAISSGSSHVQLNKVQPGDDFVWLVVNNIDIDRLEIHRGIKPR